MLAVSANTKELLKTDSVYKEMEITLYDSNGTQYIYGNDDIYYEEFELSESILDGQDMTFMGCISNEMRVTIRNKNNLRDNAFDDSPVSVSITPYESMRTKNLMPGILGVGDTDTGNGITYVVNDDSSITVRGTATSDFTLTTANFKALETKRLILSGCPFGGTQDVIEGILYVSKDGIVRYHDVGSDVYVDIEEGSTCIYQIFIASGQTVNMTFSPMLRETTESATYEPYGDKLVQRDTIPLFVGYVENGQYHNDKGWLKITAYDALYFLQSFNIWNWYRNIFTKDYINGQWVDRSGNASARTLDTLLESLCEWTNANCGYSIELSQTRCPIILEDVQVKKRLNNKEMTFTNFLKSFCQLSCACAIIDRNGDLQLVYMDSQATGVETITYYREFTSKDYIITPFSEGITIRTNTDDNGVTLTQPPATPITVDWGDDTYDTYVIDNDDIPVDTGRYFIENNGLVKKLSKRKREAIIEILLDHVQTSYYTFKSYNLVCNGLPYLECGDRIVYQPNVEDTPVVLMVVNRKLKGIQAMTDTYSLEVTTSEKYGGDTSKKKDTNIEQESSTTNLTTASFTQNGSYSAYDYDAMGFSSVTVNVDGGGGGGGGGDFQDYRWTKLTDFPVNFVLGSCVVFNNEIHLIGNPASSGNYEPHYVYNGVTWVVKNNLPIIINETCIPFVLNNTLYLYNDLSQVPPYESLYKWDPSTDSWIFVGNLWGLPFSASVPLVMNGKLYVFSLSNGNWNTWASWDGVEAATMDWTIEGGFWDENRLPYPCFGGCAFNYHNEIHIIGGGNNDEPNPYYDTYNDYYDGVTPSYRYHTVYRNGAWVRLNNLPLGVKQREPNVQIATFCPPYGIVLNDEIHIIQNGFHLIWKEDNDSWIHSTPLWIPNPDIDNYETVNIQFDAFKSAIVALGNEIHVIGGTNNQRWHWKCAKLLT